MALLIMWVAMMGCSSPSRLRSISNPCRSTASTSASFPCPRSPQRQRQAGRLPGLGEPPLLFQQGAQHDHRGGDGGVAVAEPAPLHVERAANEALGLGEVALVARQPGEREQALRDLDR